MNNVGFHTFLHGLSYNDLSSDVLNFAKRCLLDLTGVMISGRKTLLANIIVEHAKQQFAAGNKSATIMLDGHAVSPAGAAMANGMMIDSVDAHDGYKPTKGHIGCHVLPALLALSEAEQLHDGKEFLANLVTGYEIGGRAALALHESVSDYHTSGAWGAVTAAALGSRLMQFDQAKTREAIGIAEYHGPRSQMMRCIDHPTMVKDGSGWGAMAGVSAAYLAQSGFTGAPALTVEAPEVESFWADLGDDWIILKQYFKPYPVCRWAQPAAEAALSVSRSNNLQLDAIERIDVFTFHEGCRLAVTQPETTEQAQYSLPFPVAAALVFGKVGPNEVSGEALENPRVLDLAHRMNLLEHSPYNDAFPEERFAHVHVYLKDGSCLKSETHTARGDPEDPLTDEEVIEKFFAFSNEVIGYDRAKSIHDTVMALGEGTSLEDYIRLVSMEPVG